jgi:hypothetical protein
MKLSLTLGALGKKLRAEDSRKKSLGRTFLDGRIKALLNNR